jgi:K+-transporting ATPase KdpF subunit
VHALIILGALLAVFLFAYLVAAMLKPEWFE